MSIGLAKLYNFLTCGTIASFMVVTSLKKPKKKKKAKKLEKHIEEIAEDIPVEEPETTLSPEEIKQITEEQPKTQVPEQAEQPDTDIHYDVKTKKKPEPYDLDPKKEDPTYKEQITAKAEESYTDPAAIKAGLPRKGYVESKGLLKDAMLEELKKKHEEDTKKEYAERHKKIYGHK